MTGDIGVGAGARNFATDPAVRAARSIDRSASERTASYAERAPPATPAAVSAVRRACHSTPCATRLAGVYDGRISGSGSGPASGGSGSRSKSMSSSFIPPTPSLIEWCTLSTSAARPCGRPSTSVSSQSGRARSKSPIAAVAATSRTASNDFGFGARTRRA